MRCSNSLSSTLTWSVATFGATLLASVALAQDECATAVTVTSGAPSPFNTTTATPSANPPTDAQCTGTFLSWGTANPDVWFRFTAPSSGTVEVTTCQGGSFDTSMAVYSGSSCGSLTQVACNGDGTGLTGCQGFYSRVAGLAVNAGEVLYVRVGGYFDPEDGTYASGTGNLTLNFTAVDPSCQGATGDCAEAHGGLGCSDPVCCSEVCVVNPICCEVEWDAGCVETAIQVEACGIFVYSCSPAGGPANDCATNAELVTASGSRTFNNTTASALGDGPDHPAATCSSGNNFFFNDIWYRVPVAANGQLKVETCNAVNFDSKLAVYDMGTNPAAFDFNTLPEALVGCNDDGDAACQVNAEFASSLTVNVQAGRNYLVRVATYDTPGNGTVTFTLPVPCALDTPTQIETEACGDATNNGCNAAGEAENITLGGTVSGRFWADNNTRDTDFYRLNVLADSQVTVSVKSASFVQLLLARGPLPSPTCTSGAGIDLIDIGSGACPTSTSFCLAAGEYFIFVGPADASGAGVFTGLPCGNGALNNYSLKVTGTPASCPVTLSGGFDGTTSQPGVCAEPGPTTITTSTALPTTGLVACAAAPAFPNCAVGGSGANSYARVIPAGQLTGELSCIDLGVYSIVRDANAANTGCALYISDRALPATVGIYADLDGGAPRNKTANGGVDGNDLQPIHVQSVLVPGGVYRGTLNLAEPVCVADYSTKNLVVIMDCPNFSTAAQPGVPQGVGYQLRPAGAAVTGQNSNTYVRLSCADGAGQYVLAETLGGTFTAQWVVNLNGSNGSCGNGGGNDCPADLNGDGLIGALDLTAVLAAWGTATGDINGDGTTNGVDLTSVLSAWNTACP
ncbi:MAG: hypothetical protein FGM37_08500 [Phycisphaerales bacterium]|nr:hypothetical protein [Phycisphaerales bacterium]